MEAVRVFLAEKFVEMLSRMGYLVIGRIQQGKIIHQNNGIQAGHLRLGEAVPHHVAHEQDAGIGMIDKMIDVAALKLVQQRHRHSPVGQGCEKRHRPVGLVTGAYRNLVTPFQSAHLQHDMYLLYLAGHIPVIESDTVVIRQSRTVPVLLYAFFYDLIQRFRIHTH